MALKLGSTGSALRVGSTTAKYARVGTTLKAVAPPLDIAGSAAAAYSLRKLSYAYTGPVVEVRRSSDDTTADFTADEVEDGTLAAWIGAGNDGFVATWYDQSGNSQDATQATAGYQPKIADNGSVVTQGGKPAIRFDGSNHWLALSLTSLSPFSVFAVQARDGIGDYGISLGRSDPAPGPYALAQFPGGDAYARTRDGYKRMSDSNTRQVLFVTISGSGGLTALQSYREGTLMPFSSIASVTTPDFSSIGRLGASYHKGEIQELVAYSSDQTANRTAVEGNICWHYGLQNKLPYNHAEVKPQTLPTDTDVLAFAAASGAVSIPDLLKVEDLVAYLKAQSLWDYARFYPMKSAQNAGSGSTVYGLGGLTSNNMTLVNSPTWGSDGVTFNGSTQYGNVGDITGDGELYIFARVAFSSATPSASEALAGYYDSVANKRGPIFTRRGDVAGDPFNLNTSSDGINADDLRTTGHSVNADNECLVAAFLDSGVCEMYQNKTQRTLVRAGGVLQTGTPFNTDIAMFFAAYNGSSGATAHSGLTATCPLFLSGTPLTTTQRETITDLINAL